MSDVKYDSHGRPYIKLGSQIRYVDSAGELHKTPQQMAEADYAAEAKRTNVSAGNCPQDPSNVSNS